MGPDDRLGLVRILHRIGDVIAWHADQLVEFQIRDNGKLIWEMRGHIAYIIDCWQYFSRSNRSAY